jgi:arabinose-5-phosphate isomerase
VSANAENRTACRQYGEQCLREEAQALLGLIPQLDDNFDAAAKLILNCRGKLIVTGVGKSGHIGAKIAATLASTGTPAFFVNPLDAYHGDLGVIGEDDVVLAISYSGNTDELLRFIPLLLKRRVKIIGMSGFKDSLLGRYSDVFLRAHVEREADPNNLAPTASTTAALALGDALACALIRLRAFKSEDFAQFHPGGSLGRRLLTTAEDVMHKAPLPCLAPDTRLGDALIAISDGKLGLGIINAPDGTLLGLITDGDMRRAMQKNRERFFETRCEEVMTKEPCCVSPQTRIAEVEKLFSQRLIHSVLVTDDRHQVIGVVDQFQCML